MPGSHIPILPPSAIVEFNPDCIIILPWNISNISIKELTTNDTKFVTVVPN